MLLLPLLDISHDFEDLTLLCLSVEAMAPLASEGLA